MNETQGNLALVSKIDTVPEEKIAIFSSNVDILLKTAKLKQAITTAEQFEAVNNEVVRIKNVRKQVKDLFADSKDQAHKAHVAICAAEKKLLDPLEQAENQYSPMIINYTREQERIRKAEEARLQREAEAAAEVERKRLLAEAESAMDSGAGDTQVEELIAQAETVIPVPQYRSFPSVSIPKPIGLSIAQNWTYEITDEKLIPRAYLIADEKKLLAQAKATKDTINVPGIRFYDAGSVRKSR